MSNLAKYRCPSSTQTAQQWADDNKVVGTFSDYRVICSHLGVTCHKTQSGKVALSQAITAARKRAGVSSVAAEVAAVPDVGTQPCTPEELAAAQETANRLGKPVMVSHYGHGELVYPQTMHTHTPAATAQGAVPANDQAVTAATLMQQAITLLGVAGQPSTELSPEQVQQVEALIRQHTSGAAREIVVKTPEGASHSVGVAHEVFDDVLALVSTRTNIYLHGPAGTGKSHIAKQVADALGLPFAAMSFTAQSQESKLFGYISPISGEYIPTEFYKIYSGGGVFCLDEADAANPNLLNGLNMAIAQGEAPFPCGMVAKHPDFICIASANTFGDGATEEYIGRNPLDKATKDRFQSMFVGYDKKLEQGRFSEAACLMVWGERERLQGRKGWVLSMRALERVDRYLALGWSLDKVYNMAIAANLPENCRK